MTRSIRLVLTYARRAVLEWFGYRSFLVTLVVNQAVAPLLGLAVWSAALPDRDTISTYFIALLIVQLATASQEYYSVTMVIYEGTLNDELLRPHVQIIGPLAQGLAYRFWNLAIGLPVVAIAVALGGGGGLEAGRVGQALPALALAVALGFLFTYILCLSALWLQQAGAITDIGTTLTVLLGGIAIPVMLLPDPVRLIAMVLPFRAMAGFPAEIASGELAQSDILLGYLAQVAWLGVLVMAAVIVWRAGIRHYSAVGG